MEPASIRLAGVLEKGWKLRGGTEMPTNLPRPPIDLRHVLLARVLFFLAHMALERSGAIGGARMATVFIEARPKGRQEGSAIEDYVVEDHADHVLHASKTQEDAIAWARREGHKPHVARVRHLNDKKKPDQWRAV
jgi:hypothetical protein